MNTNTQTLYVIGDVHGCLPTLTELFEQLDETTPIIFLGDVINRGPNSLETLRFVKSLGKRARCILGNHDLHLLATAAGSGRIASLDTIDEILSAPDAEELLDYVRHQSLFIQWQGFTFVHAAMDPAWDIKTAQKLAAYVEKKLRAQDWRRNLMHMYGKDLWDEKLRGDAKLRAILNGFTRIRFVDEKGIPNYKIKDAPGESPAGFMPWFDCPARKTKKETVVFGHWSTLGLINRTDIIALDTGCVWGGALSAMELPARKIIQVKAPMYRDPLAVT